MRTYLRVLSFVVPLAVVVLSVLLPLPLRWTLAGVVFGLLTFQLAVVGSFDEWLPSTRRYIRLRSETAHLLDLVRQLNEAAIEARELGADAAAPLEPILHQLHQAVDRLPAAAGAMEHAARLHLPGNPVLRH